MSEQKIFFSKEVREHLSFENKSHFISDQNEPFSPLQVLTQTSFLSSGISKDD